MSRYLHFFLWLLFLLPGVAISNEAANPPRLPWHFVNVWWDSPSASAEFNEISIDFQIIGEPPSDVGIYIAPLGLAKVGTTAMYGGLQTRGNAWRSKQDQSFIELGNMAIFSRWSADNTAIDLDYARGQPGTHFVANDSENHFISVRRKLVWGSGEYTYFLRKKILNKQVWLSAAVKNQQNKQETEIGMLRIANDDLALHRAINSFVELYGTTSRIPRLALVFSEPKVDGQYRSNTRSKILYPSNGMSTPQRYASAFPVGRKVYIYLLPSAISDGLKQETLQ